MQFEKRVARHLYQNCAFIYTAPMKRLFLALCACVFAVIPLHAQTEWFGNWTGSMEFTDGTLPVSMRLCEAGALLDMPAQQLYGFPSSSVQLSPLHIEASFPFGSSKLVFIGERSASKIEGSFNNGQTGGTLSLSLQASAPARGETSLSVPVKGGKLPGTLLVPNVAVPVPLVIFHAGLGVADRNGNNYNVKGKNDALKMLAESLQMTGVATYRYDKRGAGEAFWMVSGEKTLSPNTWTADLAACTDYFTADRRFSSVWLLGLNDGALVASAAAVRSAKEAGLIIACANSDSALETYGKAIAEAPEEYRAEGNAILASLKAGKTVASVGTFYAASFRPSFQPYLVELFKYDIKKDLAAYKGKVMVIQGDRDLQATMGDYLRIMAAYPAATGVVIPEMNHALKLVSPFVDENERALSDPDFPVPLELVAAIRGFVSEN